MIGFVGAIFAINLVVIVVITLLTIKRKLYLRSLKKKYDAQVKPANNPIDHQSLEDLSVDAGVKSKNDATVLEAINEEDQEEEEPSSSSEEDDQELSVIEVD